MNSGTNIKSYIVQVICLLYVLLFVYAGVSKILDFENFQVQLGQSPLLSAFASWISWVVLAAEFITAILLLIPKYRKAGLAGSLALMTMFTAYIFIILHYSSFIPCSCGGILEKMSWNVHLAFNIFFVLLSILALTLNGSLRETGKANFKYAPSFKLMALIMVLSTGFVVLLFLSSEDAMHHRNPFLRRYPHHPAEYSASIDLKYNSYYFAGHDGNRIYLGNYDFPSYILSMDSNLRHHKSEKISFSPGKIPFKIITINVQPPYFYLYDGSVPAFFRGDLKNWKITKEFKGIPYFTRAVPIDGTTLAFRSNNSKKLANVLGVFSEDSIPKISYKRDLLQKQIDGIFDTDGALLYSDGMKKMIYVYYYRNELIVADKTGSLSYRGHTIDTITHVRLKVSALKNGSKYKMSSPPLIVNSNAAVFGNLLFVHSLVQGRYENEKLWSKSFIIDLYDLKSKSYLLSFPVYHTASSSLYSFIVTDSHLFAIIGNDLVAYKLNHAIRKEIKDSQ